MTASDSARGVQQFFQREASRFDSIYTGPRTLKERLIDTCFHQVIRLRFDKTLELLGDPAGKRVLDVGCGPGHYMVELLQRGAAEAVGVDFASEMVGRARQSAEAAGVAERCKFAGGDFLTTAIDGSFQACVAIGYFEYLRQPIPHLQRMAELTRGDIVASFPKRYTVRTLPRALRYRRRGCFLRFYTEGSVQALAEAAGFPDAQVYSVSRDYLLHIRTT